jgi:hypothetical protein
MNNDKAIHDALQSREPSKPSKTGTLQEFIVAFTPAIKLRCRVVAQNSNRPRELLFGRGETESFGGTLEASRIIATPEGNPTGIFAAGFPTDARASFRVFFFNEGAKSGDLFVFQMEEGTNCELRLFAVMDGNPGQIYNTTITDNNEHSVEINLPRKKSSAP